MVLHSYGLGLGGRDNELIDNGKVMQGKMLAMLAHTNNVYKLFTHVDTSNAWLLLFYITLISKRELGKIGYNQVLAKFLDGHHYPKHRHSNSHTVTT